MSTAIVKRAREIVAERMEAMLAVVPAALHTRFRQAAIAISMSKGIAECTPESVASSVFYCARWGMIPDPALRQMCIIPFREKGVPTAKPILMYNGLIDLARNADPSLLVRTGCVYDNDEFRIREGSVRSLEVTSPHWLRGEAPGTLLFSWCAWRTSSQPEMDMVFVPAAELVALKNRAIEKSWNGQTPWRDNLPAMCEKTAIRRASRRWTLSPNSEAGRRLREVANLNDDEGELPDIEINGEAKKVYGADGVKAALVKMGNGAKTDDTPAPGASPAETAPTPGGAENVAGEGQPAAEASLDTSTTQNGGTAPSEDEAKAIRLNEILELDWSGFVEACAAARPAGSCLSDPMLCAVAIAKKVLGLGRHGKENSITREARKEIYAAVRENRMSADGKITK